MYRTSIALVFLLSGSSMLSAQTPKSASSGAATLSLQHPSQSSTIMVLAPVFPAGCPIAMQARHGVWDHTIKVHQNGETYTGPLGQRIELTLTSTQSAKIVAATVLVRGFDGKNRMVQAGSADEGNASRTLRTGFTYSGNNTASADLYISGFTAVTSVKLQDVTYADGSTWRANQSNPCRIAPDPLMLVAAH
jgi:hypothetical protein